MSDPFKANENSKMRSIILRYRPTRPFEKIRKFSNFFQLDILPRNIWIRDLRPFSIPSLSLSLFVSERNYENPWRATEKGRWRSGKTILEGDLIFEIIQSGLLLLLLLLDGNLKFRLIPGNKFDVSKWISLRALRSSIPVDLLLLRNVGRVMSSNIIRVHWNPDYSFRKTEQAWACCNGHRRSKTRGNFWCAERPIRSCRTRVSRNDGSWKCIVSVYIVSLSLSLSFLSLLLPPRTILRYKINEIDRNSWRAFALVLDYSIISINLRKPRSPWIAIETKKSRRREERERGGRGDLWCTRAEFRRNWYS